MNKLFLCSFCAMLLVSVGKFSIAADSFKPSASSDSQTLTTKERTAIKPMLAPSPAVREFKGKISVSETVPLSVAQKCIASKTVVLPGGGNAMGCRETPPAMWQAQGCSAAMGCCQVMTGCLVSSPTNTVRGDGIY